MFSGLVSLHRARQWTWGVDLLPHSRIPPGHFVYCVITSSPHDQTELTAWAGCLADQQLEFSDKNYSVTVAGVWSRLEVTFTVMYKAPTGNGSHDLSLKSLVPVSVFVSWISTALSHIIQVLKERFGLREGFKKKYGIFYTFFSGGGVWIGSMSQKSP